MQTRRGVIRAAAAAAIAGGLSLSDSLRAQAAGPRVDPPVRTGGPRFKVGSCAYSYRKYLQSKTEPMTLLEFLDICAGWGLDGVELTSYYFPEPITAAYIHRLARRAFLLGLEVSSTAVGNTFCIAPGPQRDANLAKVKQWIEYAVDMGAPCLRVFAGGAPAGTDPVVARQWVIDSISECLPYAESHGVMLAMENHGGVVADAAGTLAILQAVKSDWFGLKWDSCNYRTPDPYADLAQVAPYAVTTHIKTEVSPNGHNVPADLPRILGLLRGVGYRGYLLLEYEAAEEPKTAVPRALATLQKLAAAPA